MGHSLKELRHFIVAAADGDIGEVKDVYFDDEHWAIRYMVVETGRWLNGRKVLVSPNSVRDVVWDDRIVNVELSRQQVRDSPSIDTDKPVSRQHEVEYYNYYGYPNDWEGSNPWGLGFYPVPWVGASADSVLSAQRMDQARMREPHPRVGGRPVDSHLRSTREVIGYEIGDRRDDRQGGGFPVRCRALGGSLRSGGYAQVVAWQARLASASVRREHQLAGARGLLDRRAGRRRDESGPRTIGSASVGARNASRRRQSPLTA